MRQKVFINIHQSPEEYSVRDGQIFQKCIPAPKVIVIASGLDCQGAAGSEAILTSVHRRAGPKYWF